MKRFESQRFRTLALRGKDHTLVPLSTDVAPQLSTHLREIFKAFFSGNKWYDVT